MAGKMRAGLQIIVKKMDRRGAKQGGTNNPIGSGRGECLLKQGPVLTQNIFPRDFVGNSTGLQNCLATEDQDFIEIKYGVAGMVEDDTFVGVFPAVLSGGTF